MPAIKNRNIKEEQMKRSQKNIKAEREHRKSRLSRVSMKNASLSHQSKTYHVLTRSKSKLLNNLDSSDKIKVPNKVKLNHKKGVKKKQSPSKSIEQNIQSQASGGNKFEVISDERKMTDVEKITEVKPNVFAKDDSMFEEKLSISVYSKPSSMSSSPTLMLTTYVSPKNSNQNVEIRPQGLINFEKDNATGTSSQEILHGISNSNQYLEEIIDVNSGRLDETKSEISEKAEIAKIRSNLAQNCSRIVENSSKGEETVQRNVNDFVDHELWKKTELYSLQRDIVRMERQKLDVLRGIFNNLYRTFF